MRVGCGEKPAQGRNVHSIDPPMGKVLTESRELSALFGKNRGIQCPRADLNFAFPN